MSAEAKGVLDYGAWALLHVILFPALIVGQAAADAWAASKVWAWFLEPTYGLSPSWTVFYGVAFLANLLTHQRTVPTEKGGDLLFVHLGWAFVRPAFIVASAWLVWKVLV